MDNKIEILSTKDDGDNIFDDKKIMQGHILKFMKKRTHHIDKGIICFPEQTYGISKQSPNEFKHKYGLTPQKGYQYLHQNNQNFKYYSQKRYFSIEGSTNQSASKNIHFQNPENSFKFHRKKGRLTEFMDKNGWMNKTTKIMGFQRNEHSRLASNKDRSIRIQTLKPKINYHNEVAKRPDTSGQYFKTMDSLTSQKMRIRNRRNQQANTFSMSVQPRNIESSHRTISRLQKQRIEQKMLQSARKFSPSRDIKRKCQQFAKTFYTTRMSRFQRQISTKKEEKQYDWQQNHQQTLEDWHRTTCNSKWAYNKKLDSQQSNRNENKIQT